MISVEEKYKTNKQRQEVYLSCQQELLHYVSHLW